MKFEFDDDQFLEGLAKTLAKEHGKNMLFLEACVLICTGFLRKKGDELLVAIAAKRRTRKRGGKRMPVTY